MAQTVARTSRSVLATGREGGAGLWATGSALSPPGRSAAREAAGYGFRGHSSPRLPGREKGRLRRGSRDSAGRARRGAERTAPRKGEASRRRQGSEAEANWEGGLGPRAGDPRAEARLPGSRGARTAPRAAGDSSLNLENNFELLG